MAASAFAQSVTQLAALRVFTGLGIGGMLASVGVIAAEYSSERYRSFSLAMYSIGYPIGATIGGVLAVWLIDAWGWRSVFIGGALASLAAIPVVLRYLPESLDFLVTRRPRDALPRLNALLSRMRLPWREALPEPAQVVAGGRGGYARLFSPALLRTTLLIALAFFMLMFGTYFVLSWTPKLLVDAGMSAEQGITGGVLLNLGGIVGGGLFGWLTTRLRLRPLIAMFLVATSVALALFGYVSGTLALAFAVAVMIGFALFGSMAGLYALAPTVYDASVRTTGLGWAIGIGRIGAIIAPAIVGVLIDAGWHTSHLYYVFALPLLAAAGAVLLIRTIPVARAG
jgi:MFS family permease